ncbi:MULTISPECIES: multiple monosaccharide ABC transporter ATP-binding protein [Treponema]|uniref:Monosaccharide-transporting ATPase n=1 Tax=Treponema succinifaciens (strain ATCC 33096 / DSM 2489 / 6091) TaxID=869209 RepID=F2NWK8_TRES6|nr:MULTISPECIES: multiple monosaccharide ABC transporter ATP-binding protein [Treponema]AEB15197.1 Monosaccharide-transporting ATPase [Treponema succinifaciens DSM 2489]MCI6911680.1 ATP-binding cassette domain-containing protein [Treponema succinifaciens]MDD6962037.1 sugar ABC transporter ATP-binding protein [Treponema succinifaciens]MDY2616799.1 multiple monosaccharide ABC transporter ATP-binding protein [Treponema succinifaciens]MDY5117999.1 multiple monosaccharide ABC transporter ATP-bindin
MAKALLEMRNITKEFPGVKALNNVTLSVEEGEIHALCGENGAGKSTLMNVLSGIYGYGSYSGDIIYDGKLCKFQTIKDSESLGIVIIHQELALVPLLTIAENMFLGNERGSKFKVDWAETFDKADSLLAEVGLKESSHTLIKDIGVGKQQLVEIAKALGKKVRLLILDEPTASLNENESKHLLDLLLEFKKQGMTSIIISHKLNEISYVADKITVIRDGAVIKTLDKSKDDFSENTIIAAMVGRDITDRFPKRASKVGDVCFEVKNWCVDHPVFDGIKVCDNVNFNLRKGEVLGISGLMGAGRTELAMSIFGHSYGANISGQIFLNGKEIELPNVKSAISHKIAYVTEDRKGNGLILSQTITQNTVSARPEKVSKHGIYNFDECRRVAQDSSKEMRTKCATVDEAVGNLSGGNMQKVLLGKWLFADPDILILDEPTRGIDVGAKYEIYCIINRMVAEGKSVILISSEMPEVLGMSDRIYVMNEGRMIAEMNAKDASQEKIMSCIISSENK